MRDPRNTKFNDGLFLGSGASDSQYFVEAFVLGGYRSVSYLAPATFQYWGTPRPNVFVPGKGLFPGDEHFWNLKYGGVPYNWGGVLASNIKTPREYRPLIDNIGASPSQKVIFADGTRFVESNGLTDIDIAPTPAVFGSFVSGFFANESETSYGRTRPGIFASARRAGLSGNVDDRVLYISFFDGSARPVSVTNAKARPDWWAPTGSEWVSLDGIAPEASTQYDVGDLLP